MSPSNHSFEAARTGEITTIENGALPQEHAPDQTPNLKPPPPTHGVRREHAPDQDRDTTAETSPRQAQNAVEDTRKTELKAQSERQKLLSPVQITQQPDPSSLVPEVRRCDWENFINRFSKDEPIYAIEALVTGDQLGKEMIEEAQRRKESGYFQAADYEAQSRVTRLRTNTTWVQRVRIQSPRLLEVLGRVTGYAWATSSYTFLHPFQYLIHHHEALKQELDRLALVEAAADDASQYSSEPRSSTIHHLRCYIGFVETDILPRYQLLRGGVHHGSLRVRFHELWYLFKLGDLIYMPDKTIKHYVIERVETGLVWSAKASDESTMRQRVWRLWDLDITPADPASPVDARADNGSFSASLYYLDFDGTSYTPVAWNFSISYFEGEKDVRDLEFYPLKYARGASEILEERINIGRLFTKCREEWHMMYSGWTLITHPMGWPIVDPNRHERQIRPEHIEGEVIVDFSEAYNAEPFFKETFVDQESWSYTIPPSSASTGLDLLIVWTDSSRSSIVSGLHETLVTHDIEGVEYEDHIKKDKYMRPGRDSNIVPEGDDLALLPPRLYVYSLRDTKFVAVDVRHLKSLRWRDDGFNQLQLQEDHKLVIQSSVRSYLRRRPAERRIEKAKSDILCTQDFIRGKGRGLLIMLHGEPGTGKTATAEAVAQTYRRPLLSISCGKWDRSWMAEESLEVVFRLANLWDCILLLDEADVFLSARTSTDNLLRNSLVSIFLTRLEYYNGILFLTTNRIGKIDPAISSRLHLILHYKRLKEPEIMKVFRINIDRLRQSERQLAEESGERPIVVVEKDVTQFVTDHCAKHPGGKGAWNGRQIRNAFVIAAGMARDEAEQQESSDFQPQLRYSHFKQVEKLFEEFVHFRVRVLGKDESQQALLNEERDDDFDGITEEEKKHAWPSATSHAQPDVQVQRMASPAHVHFARQAPTRQQPGMGANFGMASYGQEPQPPNMNTWGIDGNSGHRYTTMPSGLPMGQAHRAPYITIQTEPALGSQPAIPDLGGYGQRHIQGHGSLMVNSQAPQQISTAQTSASHRQNAFVSGGSVG
ncbi:hypothetical protein ACJ41O_011017 [Fusarium nematophilum]